MKLYKIPNSCCRKHLPKHDKSSSNFHWPLSPFWWWTVGPNTLNLLSLLKWTLDQFFFNTTCSLAKISLASFKLSSDKSLQTYNFSLNSLTCRALNWDSAHYPYSHAHLFLKKTSLEFVSDIVKMHFLEATDLEWQISFASVERVIHFHLSNLLSESFSQFRKAHHFESSA